MANFAANAELEYPPGNALELLSSQTANILAAVARGQFDNDQEYWAYPTTAPVRALSAPTARRWETGTDGTCGLLLICDDALSDWASSPNSG